MPDDHDSPWRLAEALTYKSVRHGLPSSFFTYRGDLAALGVRCLSPGMRVRVWRVSAEGRAIPRVFPVAPTLADANRSNAAVRREDRNGRSSTVAWVSPDSRCQCPLLRPKAGHSMMRQRHVLSLAATRSTHLNAQCSEVDPQPHRLRSARTTHGRTSRSGAPGSDPQRHPG
jgi:hypothetical protein